LGDRGRAADLPRQQLAQPGGVVDTIADFTALYGTLTVIEVRLILAAIRHGPDEREPA
jgi:hypothetical protein